jgi:hypothetical protein
MVPGLGRDPSPGTLLAPLRDSLSWLPELCKRKKEIWVQPSKSYQQGGDTQHHQCVYLQPTLGVTPDCHLTVPQAESGKDDTGRGNKGGIDAPRENGRRLLCVEVFLLRKSGPIHEAGNTF